MSDPAKPEGLRAKLIVSSDPTVEGPQAPAEFIPVPFTAEGLNRIARSLQVAGGMQDKRFNDLEGRLLALEQERR